MKDYINGWYYMQPNWRGRNLVCGPLSVEELLILFEKGEVNGKTQIRCDPTSPWKPLEDLMPLITSMARRSLLKTKRPIFWKRHKAVFLIILVIIGSVIAGKQVSNGNFKSELSRVLHGSNNTIRFERKYPGQEILSREAIVGLTNSIRTASGLVALSENQLLTAIAEERAKDMLEKQYFDHISPTGEQASDLAQRVGYRYKIIAENIASGMFMTNQKIVDGWMQSPGHRDNIISPEVREIGVSVMKGRMNGHDGWVSVQIFGLQSLHVSTKLCTPPSQQLINEIEIKKVELRVLNESLTSLKAELEAEKTSIELDRTLVGKDAKRNQDLNIKIKTYNEKSNWHNETLVQLKAKEAVLNSMITEYNKILVRYKDCQS